MFLGRRWYGISRKWFENDSVMTRERVENDSVVTRLCFGKILAVLAIIFTIGVGNVWGDAAVGDVLWAEDFSGYSANDVPSGSITNSHTGTTVYSGTLTYTSVNGTKTSGSTNGGQTKIWENASTKSGESPELLVGKNGSGKGALNGYFSVSGIPNGGATAITVAYTTNAKTLNVTVSGDGYTGSYQSTTKDDHSFDISVDEDADDTFTLTFTAAGDNVRLDDISVVVKTAGGGSTKTLSSIDITTQPTTTKYLVGETFSKTGAVVTATYDDSSTADVSSSATWAPTTGLTSGSNTITASYTEGGVTKTATTTVTAYTVTVNKVDEDGTAIADAGVTASCTGRTLSQSVGSTNYVFKEWQLTTASGTSISTNSITGTPTGNVVVNAVFYKPITITYKANGSTFTTQTYARGGTLAFPASDPDGATYSCTGKTFVGWVGEANKDYSDASTPPTYATAGGSVTAAATYYAVFATASAGGGNSTVFSENFSACESTGGNDGSWSGTVASGTLPDAISSSWSTENGYAAYACIKLGSGSNPSSATTPSIDCGGAVTGTLTFKAGAWNNSDDGTTLQLTFTNCSGDKSSVTMVKGSWTSYSVDLSNIVGDIKIKFASTAGSKHRFFLDEVEVTTTGGTTYSNYATICAACDDDPTVGTAQLNGSFNSSNIYVTCPSISAGSNCAINDYGFVWKAGSAPTISDNKTSVGTNNQSTAFDGTLSGTFNTTTTYYVKAYATNNGENTTLSSTALVINPRSITFDSNGGSAVAQIFVNSGSVAVQPANPTKDGYGFEGWFTDNGTFASSVNWSATITSNQNYYAKWGAVHYTITYDHGTNGTGSISAGDKTHGVDFTLSSSTFTREGYTQDGWSTTDGGSKDYELGGSYTANAAITLYPHWTINNYTVSWSVNGSTWSSGVTDANNNANYGSTVSAPTAPTSSDCDDSKVFVGWTATPDYSDADNAPADLFTTTSPAITSDATFYAVFADAGEGGAGYSKLDWGGTVTAGQYLLSTGTYTITGPDGNKTSQLAATTFTPPTSAAASSYEVTIALIGNYFTIQLAEGRYVGWSTSTSTNLTEDAPTNETDAYLWKYTANGIQNQAATTRYLQINAAGTNGKVYTTEAEGTNWLRTYLYSAGSVSYSDYTTTCSTDPRITASPSSSWAFGDVNVGSNGSKTFTIRGTNLTAGITATLSGTNAAMFSLSSSSIAYPGSNGSNEITVTYTPTTSGSHTATLTLSSAGATNKVITLTGTGVVTCTTPELSFASAVVTKYADAANFTNTLTVTGNGRNAAITYSSSNPSKASVNATTGEVDVKAVTADGTPVVITATIAAAADNGTSCQNTTSASYNLVVAHKITWYVNGSEYTEGSPTIAVADGGSIDVLPDAPDGTATCGNKVFVGWTANSSYSNASTPPGDLFLDPSGAPTPITTDKNFYAVFATSPTANSYYKANLSRLTDGQTVIIVNHSTSKALSHNMSAADVSISGSVLTTSNTNLLWTVEIDEDNDDSYFFKVGTNYLIGLDANPWLKVDDEDVDSWTIQEDTYYYLYANAPVPGAYRYLEYYNNNFTTYGYNSVNDNQYAMDFYIPNYTNYATTCTTPFVVTATSAGHGTVEVSDTYVASGGSATLTLTPATGYGCSAITLNSGTATVGTLSDCSCTITNITSDIDITATFEKLPVYSVTFDAGTGKITGLNTQTTTISETTRTSGVTVPSASSCADEWTFAYWSTTDVSSSTTTVPAHTADRGQKYIPDANNITLYAVYTKSEGTPVYTYKEDVLTASDFPATNTTYTDFSNVSARYAGQTAYANSAITIRGTKPSGIVSTTSGGTLNKVTITFNSATTSSRTVVVYGYNTAYTDGYDIFGTDTRQPLGVKLGEMSYDGSTATYELSPSENYAYVGIRSKANALYLDQVKVKWITSVSGLTTYYWSHPTCDDCTDATYGFEKSAVTLTYPYAGTYTNTFTTNNTNAKAFTSSTPAVATVNGSTGAITVVGTGTTTITVHQNRMADGSKYCAVDDSYELTVREASVDVVEVNKNNDIIVEHEFGGNTNALIDQLVLHEEGKRAEEVFISKYFEASGSVKMVALYNGTGKEYDPSKYRIRSVNATTTQHIVNVGDYVDEWPTGKELIFYSWDTGNSNDLDVMSCVNEKNDNGEIRMSDWIAVPWSGYSPTKSGIIFGGEEAVVLEEYDGENWNVLDIIGALTADGKKADQSNTTSKGSISWGDHDAWYCNTGNELGGEETDDFELATVRCLLVRKFDVKSGKASRNTVTGNLGTGHFNTLCTEWYGKHVSKSSPTTSTCNAFTEVGKFDYYNAYTQYESVNTDAFTATNNPDGTMTIHIDPEKVDGGLAGLSCNFLKIMITNADRSETLASVEYRVPIIVAANKSTSDAIFTKFDDCSVCDVAILKDYTLTTDESGKNELHDVEVYRGAKLSVPAGKELTVHNLYLRSLGDVVPQLDVIGTLNRANTKLYFDKRVDETQWYWMTLPYDCNVADVTFRNGETPTYGIGQDWVLQYYDGRLRAETGIGDCWKVFTGDVIQKGVGYILGVTPKSGHNYVELRFPMAAEYWDKDAERATIDVPVMGTKGASEGIPVNDRGWNLVGNPYLTNYSKGKIGNATAGSDETNIIPQGLLVETIGSGFHYEGIVRYVNIPVDGGYSEYAQVAIGDQPLPPFISYFVQIEGSDGVEANVQFSNALDQQSYSPMRRSPAEYKEEDDHIVWVPFDVTNNKNEKDETTLLISNRFTDGYEMMDDLVKQRGDYYWYAGITTKPVLATRNATGEMAFNALPDTSASVTGIPVNFFAAYAGTYTFSINGKYGLDEVKDAQLWDATTEQYYNLLENDYTFSAAQGENDTRFKLFVRVERKKAPNSATDIDNLLADGELSLIAVDKTLVLSGLTGAADVYVYDMSGKLMNSDHASGSGGIWRTTVPATGVYFVRVNGVNGQQTLRAIVK